MIKFIIKFFKTLILSILNYEKYSFLSFNYFDDKLSVHKNVKSNVDELIVLEKFNAEFIKLINYKGFAYSYAAARMGFFHYMRINNIGKGDEVIINSGTCSVMINAILELGAVPIYSDVCNETFGSSPEFIEKKISKKTKLIVAQHSFGIPCKIFEIKKIALKYKILLLEDCALSLDSTIDNFKTGTIGDGAIFSFDHTKPLNLFCGGILLFKNKELNKKFCLEYIALKQISLKKQKEIFKRFRKESIYFSPNKFYKLKFNELCYSVKKKFGGESPFFNENSETNNSNCSYPYPSKMPEFISIFGSKLIKSRWEEIKNTRKANLIKLIKFFEGTSISNSIPNVYYQRNLNIVPLRFVMYSDFPSNLRHKISNIIDVEQIWFKKPIISTNINLINFNYRSGDCPVSEKIGNLIINIPLDLSDQDMEGLILKLEKLNL